MEKEKKERKKNYKKINKVNIANPCENIFFKLIACNFFPPVTDKIPRLYKVQELNNIRQVYYL